MHKPCKSPPPPPQPEHRRGDLDVNPTNVQYELHSKVENFQNNQQKFYKYWSKRQMLRNET